MSNPNYSGTMITKTQTVVISFCSTDNCNTGSAVDTNTLWCYMGAKGDYSGKQTCAGQCSVRIELKIIILKINIILKQNQLK